MADSEIVIKILADTAELKEGVKKIGEETGKIKDIAGISIDNIMGKMFVLNEGWKAASEIVSKVGEVIEKVVVEMALLGEKALQVEHGFDRMAEEAGISGNKLKQAMLNAADGTIETTKLLERGTQLITAFGAGAVKIPQLIELSRNVAKTFGLETEQVFDQISEAVRNGNTRLLKHYGIYVDAEKSIKHFALANDVAANAINQSGRSQAILNDLLTVGEKKFGKGAETTRSLSESYANLKNQVAEAIEALGVAIFQKFGPQIQFAIDKLGKLALGIKGLFTDDVGTTKAKALGYEIEQISERLEYLRKQDKKFIAEGGVQLVRDDEIKKAEEAMEKAEAQLMRMSQLQKRAAIGTGSAAEAPKAEGGANDIVDKQQQVKNEVAFQQQLNQIRLQSIDAQLRNAQTLEDVRRDQAQKERLLMEQLEIKKQEISNNEMLTGQQKVLMKVEQEKLTLEQIKQLREQYDAQQIEALQRKAMYARGFDNQVVASAELQSKRTAMAWKQSGQLGGAAVTAFGNHTIAAFKAIGNGSKSAGDALKGAFFGMLGEMAMMQGQFMFLSSIWPPNPLGMAAGLGLIALGSMLSSMGDGGAASPSGMGGDSGGGGFGGGMSNGPGAADAAPKRKDVTINIEGNYFESEQTKLAIVEAVRSASDGNDFTIQRGNRK